MASLADTVAALSANGWGLALQDAGAAGLRELTPANENPGGLRLLVHAPEGLPAKAALVVVLHGCTQTATGYAQGAGWIELADRYGFALLCPEQMRANNPNLCFNWFQPADVARGAGEAASIHAMVRQVVAEHDLDPGRVFVTGLSAGGAMANAMLAAYPETFAAGAIVAGLPYGAASNMQEAFGAMRHAKTVPSDTLGDAVRKASMCSGPWPRVSVWQGDEDATVKAEVADDLVRQWCDVHGVATTSVERQAAGRRRDTIWRDAQGAAVVELHQIAGMGHGTPLACSPADGCGTPGPFLLDVGVSSTLEIARSWGLAERRLAHGPDRRASSRPAWLGVAGELHPTGATAGAQIPAPLRTAASEIGGVITDALRSAGLLR